MRKQKPVALYIVSILIIIFGSLYLYTRPGTIEELYDFIDLDNISMAAAQATVHTADGEETNATKFYGHGEEQYDQLMEMVRNMTFKRTLRTLKPLPEVRTAPEIQSGMYHLTARYFNEDDGFDLHLFYDELTITCYTDNLTEEYIAVVEPDTWAQDYLDFVLESGKVD